MPGSAYRRPVRRSRWVGTDGTRVGSGGAAASRTGAGPGRAGRVAGADEGEVGSGGVSGSRGRGTSGLEPAEATGGWVGPAEATGGWVGAPIAGGLGTPVWPGTLTTARARWKLSTRSTRLRIPVARPGRRGSPAASCATNHGGRYPSIGRPGLTASHHSGLGQFSARSG